MFSVSSVIIIPFLRPPLWSLAFSFAAFKLIYHFFHCLDVTHLAFTFIWKLFFTSLLILRPLFSSIIVIIVFLAFNFFTGYFSQLLLPHYYSSLISLLWSSTNFMVINLDYLLPSCLSIIILPSSAWSSTSSLHLPHVHLPFASHLCPSLTALQVTNAGRPFSPFCLSLQLPGRSTCGAAESQDKDCLVSGFSSSMPEGESLSRPPPRRPWKRKDLRAPLEETGSLVHLGHLSQRS